MKFLIDAYEGLYGGLHGMNSRFIVDCDSMIEAEDFAKEASFEVMYSYGVIEEDLEEEINSRVEDFGADYDEAYEEVWAENVAYNIYELNDAAQIKSIEILEDELQEFDLEDFVEKYRK